MRYTVDIGFNVRLLSGETWPKKGPGTLLELDPPEVRFEPGEKVSKLPSQADVEMLVGLGALVPLEEEVPYG